MTDAKIEKVMTSNLLYTLFFTDGSSLEIYKSQFRGVSRPKTCSESGRKNRRTEALFPGYFSTERKSGEKPFNNNSSTQLIFLLMLERNLTVASVEKRDDKYGIWPEMSTPFSLPCILFGDRKPQRGDSIVIECEGDNIVGALWNGTRILGPARP